MAKSEAGRKGDKDFYLGFGAAIGSLAREHGRPSMAADIARSNGVTLKDLREAGVGKFDLTQELVRELRDED